MEQGSLSVGLRSELVEEQADRPVVDSPAYVVRCGRSLEIAERSFPDPNRGLMGKLFDVLIHLTGGYCLGDPFINKLRD